MATPQESITTVNGRRCTRSRARTAATSASTSTPVATPTAAAPTESTTSTIAEQSPQTQQTAASPPASRPPSLPSPPPAPPVSSSPVEQSAVVPLPTSQAAASTALGTSNEVLISLATTPLPAVLQSSAPAPETAIPSATLTSSGPVVVPSQVAAAPDLPPTRIAPTSSDTLETAVIGSPSSSRPASTAPASTTLPVAQPVVTESAGVANPTSVAAVPETSKSISSLQTLSEATSIAGFLSQTSSATIGKPTVGPVGIIAPEQGAHSGGDGHTGDGHSSSHSGSNTNIGVIVGGVVGGFVGLALLGVLLFFFLRRHKSNEGGWDEKSKESSGFVWKLKAIPAGFGVFLARLKNEKTGPLDNPYQRHQPWSSVGPTYSTTSNERGRPISEPQGQSAIGGGFVRRMSSRKSERSVLRKKTSSVSCQSPCMGIAEEPTRNNNIGTNPFTDPAPDMPKNLRISNPDTIDEQPRGPSPPQPAATPRVARDPFASLIDKIDGAPDWLRDSNMTALSASTAPSHRRTQSTASALQSHPPSSVYSRDPFADPSPIPSLPNQTTTSRQPQAPLNTYSAFPAARASNYTLFGEPGPSRPGTNTFTPGLPSNPGASRPGTNTFNAPITPAPLTSGPLPSTSRLDRQSDPFDLDRPEVLSFKGIMNQMRDSIARTTTVRSRRSSSAGTWFGRDTSPNGVSVRR